MPRPFYAVIIPLGEADHHPDQGLPGGGYYPDQGLPGGGQGGGRPDQGFNPDYPNQGLPGGGESPGQGLPGRPPGFWGGQRPGRPEYPSQGPVRPGRPVDPGFGWGGGEHPSQRPPRPGRPTDPGYGVDEGTGPNQGLPPELGPPIGPVDPWEPPAGQELPPPPEEIVDKIVVAVWRPNEQHWTVATAEGSSPAPQN
jgi:hypothetical protein